MKIIATESFKIPGTNQLVEKGQEIEVLTEGSKELTLAEIVSEVEGNPDASLTLLSEASFANVNGEFLRLEGINLSGTTLFFELKDGSGEKFRIFVRESDIDSITTGMRSDNIKLLSKKGDAIIINLE